MKEGVASNLNYNLAYCLFLPSLLYHSLSTNDLPAILLLGLTLISFAAVMSPQGHKTLHLFIALVASLDIILKALMIEGVISKVDESWMDLRVVRNIWNFGHESLIYLLAVGLSWTLAYTYNIKTKTRIQTFEEYKFLEFLSLTLEFFTPLLLYVLCFTKLTNNSSFRQWLQNLSPEISTIELGSFDMYEQAAWGLITALLLTASSNSSLKKFITVVAIGLIIRDHFQEQRGSDVILYQLKWKFISIIKGCLLLFFRIHNKAILYDDLIETIQFSDNPGSSRESRLSSHQRYVYRKRLNDMQQRNYLLVLLAIIITIVTVSITNALGNVVIILSVASSFPHFEQSRFRKYIALGTVVSLLLQPQQFIYFLFLYLIRIIKTEDHVFSLRNWWLVIELGRIIILLSRVSLLTFLIGLTQSKWLVIFTLLFRTVCSYYGQIIVFMGTEDNYQYMIGSIIPNSVVIDLVLWAYFLMLKIYSPINTIKFQSMNITNIFQEYPIVNYLEKGLKILKIFHWIAYAVISILILNSHPSLFTLLRIIPLVAVFTLGILQSHKSQWSYYLWIWNFYTALGIAFVKYFYLLSRYENLSPFLVRFLEPLIKNHQFIGLTPPDNTNLMVAFGPDFLLIVVNAVVLFIIKVQLSELLFFQARARIFEEQHLEGRLQQKLIQPQEQEKNIHYLYSRYIKPVDLKFVKASKIRVVMADWILELCFLSFLAVYYLLAQNQSKFNYLPHFCMFLYGFLLQRGKHVPINLFRFLVTISSVDLLLIYVRYFFSLIMGLDGGYDVNTVISKFLLVIISVIFQQTEIALLNYYKQNEEHLQHTFLLFKLLAPDINNETFKKEVIILYLQGYKIGSLGLFVALLLTDSDIVRSVHIATLVAIGVLYYLMTDYRRDMVKRQWLSFFTIAVLIDLWTRHPPSILLFLTLRGYYIFLEEFDLHIFHVRYQCSNKTDNEESRQKVEEEQCRLRVRHNFPQENRLEVIQEIHQKHEDSYSAINEIDWQQKNTYLTVVWLLPLGCVVLIQLGSLFYSSGPSGFFIFFFNFIAIALILKNLYSYTIQEKSIKILLFVSSAAIIGSAIFEVVMDHPEYGLLSTYGLGLFLMLCGYLGYLELLLHNNDLSVNLNINYSFHLNFCQRRALQAIDYWKTKCEMVSELGSQIHNEKKLTSLRKFFIHRQNLASKVQQLQLQLKCKASHRKTRFQRLQRIQDEEEQELFKRGQFDVYSNMLTFMSLEDLHFCYLNLNQFYIELQGNTNYQKNIAPCISNVREWVLLNFDQSLAFTIQKYRKISSNNTRNKIIQIMPVVEEAQGEENESPTLGLKSKASIESYMVEGAAGFKRFASNEEHLDYAIQEDPVEEEYHKQREGSLSMRDRQFSKLLELCSEPQIALPIKEEYRESFGVRIDQRLNELNWFVQKIVQNIEIVGLIITAGWNFFGGVYTIPTNIAIFSWAIVLQTKTTVVFWLFLMSYAFAITACKLLLNFLPKHIFIDFLFYYHANDYLYQFLIILISVVEIVFLKMGGTSEIAYSQRENIFEAFYRNLLNQASKGRLLQNEHKFLEVYKAMRHANKHSFFYRVFSKGRLKPGKDFYPMLAIIQVVILFYIFFFYDMMEFQSKNNRKSLGQILTVTQFSKNMILALFFQVMIMISDRVIVALNLIDPLNQRLENFFFSFAFKYVGKYTTLTVEELKELGKFDYLLILKYIFHVVLLVTINFFVYFYIPSGGLHKSLIPQCELSVCGKSYNYLSFFLLLYLIYFVISGLQIKHGFNRNKCRNTLMESYHWVDYYIYIFFTGIPFLWEFKKISDWTTTATALPLFHWMKFEDINARMYRSKCEAEILRAKTLGEGSWYKPLLGPLGFLFIMAIIVSPIIMYSSFNPFAVKDTITSASSRLQLVMNQNIKYNFFTTSHIQIFSDREIENKHKLLGLFDRADLYKLETSSYPDSDFPLSEPALLQLARYLNYSNCDISDMGDNDNRRREACGVFQFKLVLDIEEKIGGTNSIVWGSKTLSPKEVAALYSIIIEDDEQLVINDFYSPLPGSLANQSLVILNRNQSQYFQVYTPLDSTETQEADTLTGVFVFFKSSVKYKAAIGLLTFYLTYVVLINSLFRVYLTGSTQTIIFEGPELQKILFLCEAVRSARILQNFYQEQYLYFSLMDLMRHPKMIKGIAEDFSHLRTPKGLKID